MDPGALSLFQERADRLEEQRAAQSVVEQVLSKSGEGPELGQRLAVDGRPAVPPESAAGAESFPLPSVHPAGPEHYPPDAEEHARTRRPQAVAAPPAPRPRTVSVPVAAAGRLGGRQARDL